MSAQRDLEEELIRRRAADEHLTTMKKVLSATPDHLYLLDPDGRYLFASESAAELHGISQTDFLGKTWQELGFPAEFMAPFTMQLQAVLSSGQTVVDEILFPISSGERWFEYVIKPLLDQQGVIEAVIVTSRDITERRRVADTVRQLAAIVESSGEAIFSKTLEGVITSWNSSAERLYGYGADEVIGKSISLIVPSDRQEELPNILEQIRMGEVIQRFETVRKRKDGTLVEVSVTVSPIRDVKARIVGASTIAHDITEHKRMERELARRGDERERMMHQLESELAERKRAEEALRQSHDELVAVNKALGEANLVRSQFIATMSHELRTPLASITGFSELLLDDAKDSGWSQQQQRDLERILANSGHLLDLINDVLDLSKMEAGQMVLDYSWVDVRSLLSEVVAEVGSLAIKQNLFLKTEAQEDIGFLETNPLKLHQILLNLVTNALKFTEHGGVTVSVSRVLLSDKGVEGMAFAVQDSGIGIPPDIQERIFEAFFQADMSYTRRVGGTGLGLSIVSQLTTLLGGTISVESVPGQGSTFTVTLPVNAIHRFIVQDIPRLHPRRQVNALTPPPTAREFAPPPSPDMLNRSGQTGAAERQHDLILVVDDNPDAITFIKAALHDAPYTLIEVQDPLTVMELAQELHPCAITLDVLMPQLNGWQLLHQLKDNPATASIPIIVLTVLREQTTGYVLGADYYLIKPFKKELLRDTLRRLFEKKQGSSEASK